MVDTDLVISTDWLVLDTADGAMRTYEARPRPAPRAAVVVLQEAFGVNAHIQDVSRRLARRGYLVLAPDLFHRTGPDVVAYDEHDLAMGLIGALGPDQITSDIQAVLGHLAAREDIGVSQTAIVGFCFGGRAAFTAATTAPGLGAAVVFYGPGIAAGPFAVLDRASQVNAPMLMHVGADDSTIPADLVARIDEVMKSAPGDFEQYVYPGAGHAFACDARPHMYQDQAAQTAWTRTYEFLERRLSHAASAAREGGTA